MANLVVSRVIEARQSRSGDIPDRGRYRQTSRHEAGARRIARKHIVLFNEAIPAVVDFCPI